MSLATTPNAPTSSQVASPSGALLTLYALTSLHPGAGAALGAVDLPVQRERHTQWPTIAGSAIKGVLRDVCREQLAATHRGDPDGTEDDSRRTRRDRANEDKQLVWLFGPPTEDASDGAGALAVTDARLLAFPVRSLRGVFAWVTCPSALDRLNRDAALAGRRLSLRTPSPERNQAIVPENCPCLVGSPKSLVLEEFDFACEEKQGYSEVARTIANELAPATPEFASTREGIGSRLVVLHDDDFTHFARHATEIAARIGLDYETKTVRDGALFYQEFLPAETLLYSVVLSNAAREAARPDGETGTVLEAFEKCLKPYLQIGGDETTGKGICATRLWTGSPAKVEGSPNV